MFIKLNLIEILTMGKKQGSEMFRDDITKTSSH